MAIADCDCCDRKNVPGCVVNVPGEPFACFICQGDPNPDPYGETDEAEAAYQRDLDVVRQCIERPL